MARPLDERHATDVRTVFKALVIVLFALSGFLVWAGYFDSGMLVREPATAMAAPQRARLAAVYFSGDVGYKVAMGRMIGSRLAADGIPVVAVNSLAYFRSRRTVADVTTLATQAIRQALAFGHADQVVLIGHSLGGDALQASLADLPPDLRAKVRAVILVVPTPSLYLRVSPAEMLDLPPNDGPTLPTLQLLTWTPFTCIYGMQEADSPCPRLTAPNVTQVGLPGGHAMRWDIGAVHAAILAAIDRSAPAKVTKVSPPEKPTAMPRGSGQNPIQRER